MEDYRSTIVQYINEMYSINAININGTYIETKTLDTFVIPEVKISEKSENRFAQQMVENTMTLDAFLQLYHQVIIFGEPGFGKTTILKYLALFTANNTAVGKYGIQRDAIPVYISLAAFCNQGLSIKDYIIALYKRLVNDKEDFEKYISEKMNKGEVVILLDGLNDVSLDTQNQIIRQINTLCVNCTKMKIVIATREYRSIPHLKIFKAAKIQSFSTDLIEKYTESIIKSEIDAPNKARESKLKFINAISKKTHLFQLAQNPLFLSILVMLYLRQKELPDTRIELYNTYVEDLIPSTCISEDGLCTKERIIRVLAYIAYNMTRNDSHNSFVTLSALKSYVIAFFEKKVGDEKWDALEKTQLLLEKVIGKIGVFTYEAESLGYSIKQASIKDYLSALNICYDLEDYVDSRKKGRYRHKEIVDILLPDEKWHEILKLVVEYLAVVNSSLCDVLEMVSYALKYEVKWSTELQAKCSIIAGECLILISGKTIGDMQDCTMNCQQLMINILENELLSSSIHIGAARVLSHIGDPRIIQNLQVPEMINIKPGSFVKGADSCEVKALIDEASKVVLEKEDMWIQNYWKEILLSEVSEKKKVTITKPFRISKYPITNLQYQIFLDNTNYHVPGWGDDKKGALYTWNEETRRCNPAYSNSPVVLVSWYDANNYCKWLSKQTGRTFRLPSEDEWEYAARGEKSKKYPWGNEWKEDYANTLESGLNDIVPVGCFEQGKSDFGLMDCSGQIWEWTNTNDTVLWKKAWPSHMRSADDTEAYIVRGGAWDDISVFARCSSRGPNGASFFEHYIGFRIVEEL